ncbi:DUF4199 domain-containing protein [Maribacter sp. 2-571]|uniref:DUF4199 domain-containing protein n=1 Tax=Maribacter sp. 2-571 TaxID=3417569 RepID=UPI003D33B031
METTPPKTGKFGLVYGLILSAISVALGLILYSQNLHYERGWAVNLVSVIIMISVISIGIYQFKKANAGFLSLGQAMKVGLGIAVIAGIVGVLWQMVFMNVIEPDFMENVVERSKVEMIQQNPTLTDEQIAQGEKTIRMFTKPSVMAVMGLVASLFFGSIISLIAGLIMKKQNVQD